MEAPSSDDDMENLLECDLPSLNTNMRKELEDPITWDEIRNGIRRLPQHKAAGVDGLWAKLFRCDADLWADILTPYFEHLIFHTNQLPQMFRSTVIVLLFKKGSPHEPANYRPIALLNVIAKLLTLIYNNRLRNHISYIIPPSQTGFIPNRSITENIIYINDTIAWAKHHCTEAVITCLDFAKAYDRVQWRFLLRVLSKMGFGQRWSQLITEIYDNRSAHLIINGAMSAPFDITRGVLQGDPLSPSLFIIQASPLYASISAMEQTHGIPLPDGSHAPTGSYYADDSTLIARSPVHAAELFDVAQRFCDGSGAMLHPQRCVAIATSPLAPTLPNVVRIIRTNECTELLGVPIGVDISRIQQVERVVSRMIKRANEWSHIGRTTDGRIATVRSIILPTVWYVLSALATNTTEAEKIQKVVINFINRQPDIEWDGAVNKGNMFAKWFFQHKRDGGWGLHHVESSIHTRKLSMLRAALEQHCNGQERPRLTYIPFLARATPDQWWNSWSDLIFRPKPPIQPHPAQGQWGLLPQWWRSAWLIWARLDMKPERRSVSLETLKKWPVWDNRILAVDHGLSKPLHKMANDPRTRAWREKIRTLNFLNFGDFMTNTHTCFTAIELQNAIYARAASRQIDVPSPRISCYHLARHVRTLWEKAKALWLKPPTDNHQHITEPAPDSAATHTSPPPTTEVPHVYDMKWTLPDGKEFRKVKNRHLTAAITSLKKSPAPLEIISVNNARVPLKWSDEVWMLAALAPSRRDLLRRMVRNGLPIGSKRRAWGTTEMTMCHNCSAGSLETLSHLFWECTYARSIWNAWAGPWTKTNGEAVDFIEVLSGNAKLSVSNEPKMAKQVWAMIRTCVSRVIWLERNLRLFNGQPASKPWAARENQARLDIQAHLESCHSRFQGAQIP